MQLGRLAFVVFACAPLLAALSIEASAAPDAADAGTSSASARIPPDPPAMVERQQWVFDLRWEKGDVYLLQVEARDMGEPRVTPRVFGRFALELFEGPTLVERVRFDFPMLGGNAAIEDAGTSGIRPPVSMIASLRTRIGVIFPATTRGTRLELWDRATDVRYAMPWPPKPGVVEPPPRPPLAPEAYDVVPAKKDGGAPRAPRTRDAGAR